jgi:hypothetical protein
MPTTRCITMVSTSCSTSAAMHVSAKQAANRSVSRIARPDRPVGLTGQQGTGGDRVTVEARRNLAAFDRWKFKQCGATLCRHWGIL